MPTPSHPHDNSPHTLFYPPRWPGAVVPALVPGACLSLLLLEAFADAMHDNGLALQLQRMRYDRRYAFDRLAAAHSVSDARLRALAMRLFELY
jgi:hypothetical protein